MKSRGCWLLILNLKDDEGENVPKGDLSNYLVTKNIPSLDEIYPLDNARFFQDIDF